MNKTIYTTIGLLLVALASIVPWADAQQKPNPVIIWCQDSSGNYAPCLAGSSLDYDTGGGTVNQGIVGIAIPASGGPVAGGTSTNPVRIDPTGSTTQPVNVVQMNGVTVLMGAGNTGTGSQRVTEATDSQLSAGVGATGDAAATAGGTGSINAKLRLLTDLLNQTLTELAQKTEPANTQTVSGTVTANAGTGTFNIQSNASVNQAQIGGSSIQAASNGLNTAGSGLPAQAAVGQCDDTSPTALTENQFGHVRINCTTHHQLVDVGAALPTGSNSIGQVTANAGTNLNTSALLTTSAHDAAFGTAGSSDSQVRTVQGIASMTPLQVQSNSANVATETTLASSLTALQLIDDDQTGASVHYRTSAGATEDEHEVKGSAGRLFSIVATNTNAAARYLRCANQVIGSTTPGTTTVFLGLAIPGATTGAGFTTNFGPSGVAFSTGLTCWLVTGAADSDVTEVAANEIKVNYVYK